jgi:hypothetical protein
MYRIKQSIAKEDKTATELKNEIAHVTANLYICMIRDIFDNEEIMHNFYDIATNKQCIWQLDTRVLVTDMGRTTEVIVQGDVVAP